jgi:WD40 repeat protein
MRAAVRLLVVALVLLVGGAVWAQGGKTYLGVDLQDVTKDEAEKLGWETPRGAKVVKAREGGPAALAGLLPDDIIISLDGQEVESMAALVAGINSRSAGMQVRLRLLRAGRERTVTVTLAGQTGGGLVQTTGPDSKDLPYLMLDTGGHMSLIKGVSFTPDGKQLVSGGDDKVIRVWDWQAGRTVRTIRGQVGIGSEGTLFSVVLSPNGKWLAAAGWTDPATASVPCCGDIRLYDFPSGRLVTLLKGHRSVVDKLAFSEDSRYLISGSGLGDLSAIIWDVEKLQAVQRLQGHTAEVYAVGFSPDSTRAVTGSYDGTLKLWSVKDGKEIATLRGHKERVPALAVSPDGNIIASGDSTGDLMLWDGHTGRNLRTLGNQGGYVGAMRFTSDGKWLLSTCGYSGCQSTQRVWDVATGRQIRSYTRQNSTVLGLAISPDGRYVATAGSSNQEIHVWELATGETKKILVGTGLPRWAVGFSADGKQMAWGSVWRSAPDHQSHTSEATSPILYQLRLPTAGQPLGEPERVDKEIPGAFARAVTSRGAYTISHRKGGDYGYDGTLDIKKNGQTVASITRNSVDGYGHWAYTFTPDGQTIISGGANGFITAYDLKGQKLGNFIGHGGVIWAVTVSPDGRFLISGSDDQTVRLWNIKTRELLVTLFHGTDGEWVMWTPQGYYAASPGADKIVGWQISRGPDRNADYVGAEQLRQHLNRPDIVEKAIILASAEQAVREAPGTTFKLSDLLARPVPKFKIVSPAANSAQQGGRAVVKIAVEPTPDEVRLIRVQVNGRNVLEQTPDVGTGGIRTGEHLLTVPLAKGRNEVRIALTNVIGEKAETLVLNQTGDGDLDRRGTLHILAIGVNDYKGLGNNCGDTGRESCNLTSAVPDASAFAEAVKSRLGPSHRDVKMRVLVNGAPDPNDEPTAARIIDAVDLLRQADETDTVVLFIAGHGDNAGPDYRFLATDASWMSGALRGSTVVPWQTLQGAVEAAKGRRILFIDTCHSGNAYNQRLGNAAYHANIIAYTAARFDQLAVEDFQLKHGIFTYAVVEGLDGKAAIAPRGEISTKSLADYIRTRVGAMARAFNREQEPQYFMGRDAQDFVLVR